MLETNLDDVSGEMIGHCIAQLWDAGALDVYTTAIQMKKNRPGVKLSILCRVEKIAALEAIVFRETGTLGIRRWSAARHVLPREIRQVATAGARSTASSADWTMARSISRRSTNRAAASRRSTRCRFARSTPRRRTRV